MDKKERILYLIKQLNAASDAYYGGEEEHLSNYEWDKMFDELEVLEKNTGIIFPTSPTQSISRSKIDDNIFNNRKEKHEYPALSLAKTKKVEELQTWAGEKDIWLSWKLDGLTLVLTYDQGKLQKILTRGNGTIGTNITYMKDVIKGFPTTIDYQKHMVVRGEAIILYSDFERINMYLDEEKYANPRNLASGTLALDPSNVDIVKERNLKFIAFTLVYLEKKLISWGERMNFLDQLGFETVEREITNANDLPLIINKWSEKVEKGKIDTPVDGLVINYDDTEYASTGTVTGHHATRAGLAFKWQDEVAVTLLDHIEWSCAASVITPVAIFDPVFLEGTTVTRASLCNISEMDRLGIGEDKHTKLKIIKANKIIPKCVGVVSAQGHYTIPKVCPVCQSKAKILVGGDGKTKTLHCINTTCPAKNLRRLARFVSRQGMNIDGLSIKKLVILINKGYITGYSSIYELYQYEKQLYELDGFGEKSCKNLLQAIEKSRHVQPENFIYSLCIPLVGMDTAKRIIGKIGYAGFLDRINAKNSFDDIDGIGEEKSKSITDWFSDDRNKNEFFSLLKYFNLHDNAGIETKEQRCKELVFVVTGNLNTFKNRSELIKYIERQGGRVASSISKKTNYLINNDINSVSSKNKQAMKLRIPIITEEEFIKKFIEVS